MNIDPAKPYNKLPHLPPNLNFKNQDILLATLDASDAIAQLKTMLTMSEHTVSNTIDLLSPLFVPEAVTSSGVENIITTNDSVYVANILEERELNPAEKEVLNYTRALVRGMWSILRKGFLATNDYIELQKKLEPNKAGIRRVPGTQLKDRNTGKIYYTPPEGEQLIRTLLGNFEKYFNELAPTHEVFSRMAILHYQFEAIHPFLDGNGRTGRMLMPLYLMKQGRLPYPVLFISHYILEHRDQYYKALNGVTYHGKWKEWILYTIRATTEQARYTCGILEKIQKTMNDVREDLRKKLPRVYSAELVEFLFSNVYFTQKQFENELKISPMTARKYLQALVDQKIVYRQRQTGKNRYIYITPDYIHILKHA